MRVCVCLHRDCGERERESACVCVCVCVREREKERPGGIKKDTKNTKNRRDRRGPNQGPLEKESHALPLHHGSSWDK